MTYSGLLTEVEVTTRGTAATADVASGATAVPVEDPTDFDPAGGRVSIAGVAYDYSGVTEDDSGAATLNLATPLTADVTEGDPVNVLAGDQVATDWYAVIDPAAESGLGDVIRVPLSYTDRPNYPEGPYDPPLQVTIADDQQSIVTVPGAVPVLNGTMIDPATLPATGGESTPTQAPASSPAITVQPLSASLIVQAENVDPSTTIEYHISTTQGFAPDSTTLAMSTRSTVVAINALPDGSPLQKNTTYALVAVATNAAGSAAPSAEVDAQLSDAEVTVSADRVVGGTFASAYTLTGSLQIGDITLTPGSGGDPSDPNYDPGGLVIPLSSGGVIELPADGSDAMIQARLHALDLTVDDNATINGKNNNLAGSLVMASVPSAPSTPVSVSNATVQTGSGFQLTGSLPAGDQGTGGIAYAGGKFYTIGSDANGTTVVYAVDATSGSVSTAQANLDALMPANCTLIDKLATDGSHFYVLYQRNYASYWVRTFDISWTQTADFGLGSEWSNNIPSGLGVDGSNLLVCGVTQNYVAMMAVHSAADGSVQATRNYSTITNTYPIKVITGNADFGAKRLVLVCDNGTSYVFPAWNATNPTTEYKANRFRSTSATILGATWDGSNFWYQVAATSGVFDLRKIAPVVAQTSRSITWTQFCDGTRTGSAGTFETPPSAAYNATQQVRAWLAITAPKPSDGGAVNDPNCDRVYVANHLQATLPDTGNLTIVIGNPSTTGQAAPTTNGFLSAPNVTIGTLQSQSVDASGNPMLSLKGDGSARMPLYEQSGNVTVNATTAVTGGYTGSATVTFPVPFASSPRLALSVNATGPQNVSTSFSGVSATGFTVYLWKNASGSNTVHWIATTA